jgi:uncharacterized protein
MVQSHRLRTTCEPYTSAKEEITTGPPASTDIYVAGRHRDGFGETARFLYGFVGGLWPRQTSRLSVLTPTRESRGLHKIAGAIVQTILRDLTPVPPCSAGPCAAQACAVSRERRTIGGVTFGYSSRMDDILARLNVTEEQIAEFCRKWAIVRFELFGSALREDFDEQSDVDVLVTFQEGSRHGLSELLAMEEEVRTLFGREVDLIERRLVESSRNWVRRRSILRNARLLYAAA